MYVYIYIYSLYTYAQAPTHPDTCVHPHAWSMFEVSPAQAKPSQAGPSQIDFRTLETLV